MDKFEKLFKDIKNISFDDLSQVSATHQAELAEAIDQLEWLLKKAQCCKADTQNHYLKVSKRTIELACSKGLDNDQFPKTPIH